MNPDILRATARASIGETDTGGPGTDPTSAMAQARQDLTKTARDTAARLKSVARDTADRAKSEAQGMASDAKQQAANRIGGYSSAVHQSAKSLEQRDPNIAWATHRVADRIQGIADYIRESDLDDLKRDAEDLARRHPVAFFGSLFVAGLVVGNFLKARRPESEAPEQGELDMGNESGSTEPTLGAPSGPEM